MKPYNIEIFDRHFNFRSNVVITDADYTYDSLTVDKSSIKIPSSKLKVREIPESGSTADGTIAVSDFVRLSQNGIEYVGIVSDLNDTGSVLEISHKPLHSLFNHEVLIVADDIKLTTIEAYLSKLITEEFITNADTYQRIENLTVTTTSSTTGIFDYNDTSELYVVVNILTDIIYPAFREYLIMTDVSVDFNTKSITVTIGEINNDSITLESDLPNVISSDFTIRSTSDDVNKLSLYDTANYEIKEYDYFLHPSDYSFNRTNNSDRFFPVVNAAYDFDSDAITEDEFFLIGNENARTLKKYIEIDRDLTSNEHTLVYTAMSAFVQYIVNSKTSTEWVNYCRPMVDDYINYLIRNALNWDGTNDGENWTYASWEDVTESGSVTYGLAINGLVYGSASFYVWDAKPVTSPYHDYIRLPNEGDNIVVRDSSGGYVWRTRDPFGNVDRDGWRYYPRGYRTASDSNRRESQVQIISASDFVSSEWTNAVELLTPYKDSDNWAGGGKKYCYGTLTEKETHVNLRFTFTTRTAYTEADATDPNFGNVTFAVNIPVDSSMLSSAFNDYKQTTAFKEEFRRYKTTNFNAILDGYAKRLFKTAKYKNLIELTVPENDTMIKPLEMEIGQVVEIIHEGSAYNSILTGKEVKGGLVKLIFGTIRLELTKILNMKGV